MANLKEGGIVKKGHEESLKMATSLLEEFGLPLGLLPLADVIEVGFVKSTGYMWIVQKKKIEHKFNIISKLVSYDANIIGYLEKNKIKKLKGVKAKELMLWPPISEIMVEDPPTGKIQFKSLAGITRTFPVDAFVAGHVMANNGVEEKLLAPYLPDQDEGSLTRRVWEESKKIWRVALPGMLSRVCAFGTIVITQSFVGHISGLDLAGYALVQTLSVRFVNGILLGMSSATETLCGQAFGAGQHHMMGIYLQRSWIVDFISLTVLLPIFIFGSYIFRLLGEEESIARTGGYISLWFIPFVYNFVFSLTIQMFLQAQLKNCIIAYLSIFQFALHFPISYVFVYKFDWGVPGAMIALSLSSWFLVIGEFIYIFGGWCPQSWNGFSKAAFLDILLVVKLSISSGVMVCLELWYNAVLVLIAGYMKNAEVAISAFSICLNVNAWEFMISLGFLGAACVRVANELGKGNAKAAKFAINVLLGTSIVIGMFFFVICLIFGDKLAYLFTDDEAVAETIADLLVLLSFSVLLNSIYPVLSGVAVGAGMQGIVAIINLCCFYLIGIPLGAVLGYVAKLQVKGIWIGMIIGVVTQTIALLVLAWRTNWDDQVNKASERLNRFYLKSPEESNRITNHA